MNRFYLIFFLPIACFCQNKDLPFTTKEFHSLANYFDSKTDVLNFFDLKRNDVIADIGAANGNEDGALSLLCDSLTIYSEDIDPKLLNEKTFGKMTIHYQKLKGNSSTNFRMSLGTEKTTNLPEESIDKVVMISSFHEFAFKDEMIIDIVSKLKPGGKIYILESECLMKSHKNISSVETIGIMKKHGLSLLKIDESNRNGSVGMYKAVFEVFR